MPIHLDCEGLSECKWPGVLITENSKNHSKLDLDV